MVQDGLQFGTGVGLQHGDACRAEVIDTLQNGCGGKVTTDVQDTASLINAVNAFGNLPT